MLVMAGATIVETIMLLKKMMARTKVTVHFERFGQFRGLALSVGPSKVTSNRSAVVSASDESALFFSTSINGEIGGGWITSSCWVVWPKSCCGLEIGLSDAIVSDCVSAIW